MANKEGAGGAGLCGWVGVWVDTSTRSQKYLLSTCMHQRRGVNCAAHQLIVLYLAHQLSPEYPVLRYTYQLYIYI